MERAAFLIDAETSYIACFCSAGEQPYMAGLCIRRYWVRVGVRL